MKGVILFGDSVFVGVGASVRSKSCGKLLGTLLRVPVLVRARSNDNTRDALGRLEEEVIQADSARYSHVVILLGNNDCRLVKADMPAVSIQEFRRNLSAIVEKIEASRKHPALCNLQPIDSVASLESLGEIKQFVRSGGDPASWQKVYSNTCKEVASEKGISFVNIRERLENLGQPVTASDGLHPNDLGHGVIAKEIAQVLSPDV